MNEWEEREKNMKEWRWVKQENESMDIERSRNQEMDSEKEWKNNGY